VYYDGTIDGKHKKAMTLTGLAAPERLWVTFEAEWDKCLTGNHVYEDFHMTDFMSGQGYWATLGKHEKEKLIKDLWNVFGRNRDSRLRAYSCTVLLEEYKKAQLKVPNLREPEAMCVDFCVGGLQLTKEELSIPKPILLYFDRNEKFMHKINRVWQKIPGKNNYAGTRRGWPYQIRNIIPVDMSYIPIQAADMIAWSINHQYCKPDDPMTVFFKTAPILAVQHFTRVYDFAEIIRYYPNG
jgi:hypothetical protein